MEVETKLFNILLHFSYLPFYNGYSLIVGTSNVLVAIKIFAPGFNSILTLADTIIALHSSGAASNCGRGPVLLQSWFTCGFCV